MTNEDILKTPRKQLRGLDGQRRFILEKATAKLECPACHTAVSQVDAIGGDVNAFQLDGAGSSDLDWYRHQRESFTCPACQRKLEHCIPLIGSEHWRLREPIPVGQ